MLGYHEWREGLLRGLAAHHAGMLPVFRHTVEELFTAGLVKAVFATETLALGINMPARTVVLERLVKFDGEQHVQLTPGEYTQLTGRAGRRGIDVEGHAVVLWTPDVDPAEVAGLASTRTFPLRSSFAPSYNMTINLVNQMGPTQAHKLLERSFAQYQADRSVVGLVRGIERGERMLDEIAAELGGRWTLAETRPSRDPRVRAAARGDLRNGRRRSRGRRGCSAGRAANDALSSLRRGDIVNIANGRRGGLAVVLEPARDEDDPRPLVLTENRWAGRISSADYSGASAKVGSMSLPKRVEHRQPRVRRDVASALRSADGRAWRYPRAGEVARRSDHDVDPELAGLREQLQRHPAPSHCRIARRRSGWPSDTCASSATTSRSSRRWPRPPTRWPARSTASSCCSPSAASSATPTATRGSPTTAGCWPGSTAKATCWWPSACAAGVWEGLSPAELAGVLSAVLYESRGDSAGAPQAAEIPTGKLRRALADTRRFAAELRTDEQRHRISQSREPDEGFVAAVYRWATTGDLASALDASDIGRTGHRPRSGVPSAGDFVRWCRQVLDLADQVRNAAPTPELRAAAKRAIADVRRGVVAVDAG